MRWDCPIPNGWFPRVAPDGAFCIFGAGDVHVCNLSDGTIESLGPGFSGAWLNAQWAVFASNAEKTALAIYNPRTKERRNLALTVDVATHNDLDAKNNVIVLTNASVGRVIRVIPNLNTKDPVQCAVRVVTATGGLKAVTSGNFIASLYRISASPETWGIRRWNQDLSFVDYPVAPNLLNVNEAGEMGIGYWGLAQYINTKGEVVDVTCTLWKKESIPIVQSIGDKKWIWTGTEIPLHDDPTDSLTASAVIGRYDSSGCLLLQRQPPLYLDVVCVNGMFIVASCSDRGQLVVQDCAVDVPLQPFLPDIRPEMDQPVVQFKLDRTKGPAPLTVNGLLTVKQNVRTWRWTLNGNNHMPVEGETHEFVLDTEGTYAIDVKAQGVLADDAHLPGSGGKLTYAGVQEVIVGEQSFYREGFPGVQTGFGDPVIGADNVYLILGNRNWQAARIEASHDSNEAQTRACVQEVLDNGLRPITICRTLSDLKHVQEWTDVEWQNEPNGNVAPGRYWSPEEYAASLPAVVDICRQRHLRLWVGSINNISRDGLNYLSKIIAAVPFDVGISVHRYPEKNLTFESAHAGFSSRQDEIDQLKRIIGNRQWCVTEFGYTQKPRKSCFRTVPGLTNVEVRERIDKEMQLFRANGASCAIWFQVWESEPDSGLMDVNRHWKEPQSRRP